MRHIRYPQGLLRAIGNGKEPKDHGEGRSLVGVPINGRKFLMHDDVMTAGTANRHAIDMIKAVVESLVSSSIWMGRISARKEGKRNRSWGKADGFNLRHEGFDWTWRKMGQAKALEALWALRLAPLITCPAITVSYVANGQDHSVAVSYGQEVVAHVGSVRPIIILT